MTAEFAIQNVAPTVAIDRGGTFPVNGIPTFIARSGDLMTFHGTADDPEQFRTRSVSTVRIPR